MMPLDTSMMAKASEKLIVCLATIIGLWLLYWLGKAFFKRRASTKEVKNILNINQAYKDLVEREENLQADLVSITEQRNSV